MYNNMVCGVDEVGRGCLAGDVFAAAVILPPDYRNDHINDSKKLSEEVRKHLTPIIQKEAIDFAIGKASVQEIDQHNILQATFLAMHRAIQGLKTIPTAIEVDGNQFRPYPNIPHTCIIKGDQTHLNIAAASILAKTARDTYMQTLHRKLPMYGWATNKGYPTRHHRDAIVSFGASRYHRMSFTLLPSTSP